MGSSIELIPWEMIPQRVQIGEFNLLTTFRSISNLRQLLHKGKAQVKYHLRLGSREGPVLDHLTQQAGRRNTKAEARQKKDRILPRLLVEERPVSILKLTSIL
jgi:hypothetical protein